MLLAEAMKKLKAAVRRLDGHQGRIARRNARRAVMGALLSVKYAMQEQYPPIAKPAPRPQPRQPKKKGCRRPWRREVAQLFVEMVAAAEGLKAPLVKIRARPQVHWTENLQCIFVQESDSYFSKWLTVVKGLARMKPLPNGNAARTAERKVEDLLNQFWEGPMQCPDLDLLARHQAWLEGVKNGASTQR